MDNIICNYSWVWITLVIEFGIIAIVLAYHALEDVMKNHKTQYQRDMYYRQTKSLQSKIHEGNIRYLESKKEWMEKERGLRLKYQASLIETDQEIDKVKKQIEKLKSK